MFKYYLFAFLISMVPLIELRGAIPFAVGWGIMTSGDTKSIVTCFLICIIGNMLPVPIIYMFARKFLEWGQDKKVIGGICRFFLEKGTKAGEKLQAAAFAYCYYIIEDNKYINSFLLNRQTDDTAALKSGLALGIYNNDYSEKLLHDVFKNIDSPEGAAYIDEMLEIIGADSLEEALSWAR